MQEAVFFTWWSRGRGQSRSEVVVVGGGWVVDGGVFVGGWCVVDGWWRVMVRSEVVDGR